MLEEQKMQAQEELENDYFYAYYNVPYFLFNNFFSETKARSFSNEFGEILRLYSIYENGCKFVTEGTNGDYVPSSIRFKKSAMILNKEARFFVSNPPSFNVNMDDVTGEYKEENATIQDYLDNVLKKTNFHGKMMKGVKDCFVGKRIAIVVNFNKQYGITITFLRSNEFLYEFGEDEKLNRFCAFYEENNIESLTDQRWHVKEYEKNNNGVFLTETVYDGTGEKISTPIKKTKIKFDYIPAFVVLNDGLTGDTRGKSELKYVIDYETGYSKLANTDMDAERKSMNPIRYTIDASEGSTRNLSTSPGSYWDLQTDGDKPNDSSYAAKVGIIEANMNYSTPLKTTLDRLETEMYAELDVPNITSEQLAGVITSGKTIQALYWGLTVRCDEKMLAWESALREMAHTIIDGARFYPACVKQYTEKSIPDIPYEVIVQNNYPIPEDVKEEKELDIAEVDAKLMSKKAYLKKWRNLNDDEAIAELEQIRIESELLDNTFLNYSTSDTVNDTFDGEETDDNEDQDVKQQVDDNFNDSTKTFDVVGQNQSANKQV